LASLDGQQVKPGTLVHVGQRLIFQPPKPSVSSQNPETDIKLDILYQDDDILVINKSAGLIVHPPIADYSGPTLAGALLALNADLPKAAPSGWPGLVHRLDKNTSGVMVTAKSQTAMDFLVKAFANRMVDKRYLAFVNGQLPDNGEIDSPIGRHPTLRHKMRTGLAGDRPSRSLFRVIRRFPKTGLALVSITLLTGRTHQARVHLASIRAPVLADPIYGKNQRELIKSHPSLKPLLTRHFLHARRLTIPHPSGGHLTFRAPWPLDFRKLLDELLRLEKPDVGETLPLNV
jgi:23S rRNA pseudouridine1911/1915/1917 synthase